MAKIIKIILLLFVVASVGYLVAKEYVGSSVNMSEQDIEKQTPEISEGVVVYYFHGNRRCPTCRAIEKYSREAVAPFINDYKLTWKTVNVEAVGNKHFINDFQLKSSGPVMVEYENGIVKRRQALDKVWLLVRDKEAFIKYVVGEVERFIQ